MKYKVLGVKKINYKKRDGNQVKGTELHCVYNDPEVWGNSVAPVYVSDNVNSPDIPNIQPGCMVDIQYNNRGYIAAVYKLPDDEKK